MINGKQKCRRPANLLVLLSSTGVLWVQVCLALLPGQRLLWWGGQADGWSLWVESHRTLREAKAAGRLKTGSSLMCLKKSWFLGPTTPQPHSTSLLTPFNPIIWSFSKVSVCLPPDRPCTVLDIDVFTTFDMHEVLKKNLKIFISLTQVSGKKKIVFIVEVVRNKWRVFKYIV